MDEFRLTNEPSRLKRKGGYIRWSQQSRVIDGEYRCSKCKTWKPVSNFSSSSVSLSGLDSICKACRVAMENKRRSGDVKVYLTITARNILTDKKRMSERRKELARQADITPETLIGLWESQQGKCAISGVPMTHMLGKGFITTNASVDRIDNELGYTRGNVQLVCRVINIMKGVLSLTELKWWCQQVLAHE